MLFVPPSFEPTTPREPQWFPRPITESIESSLDLIERLEEDRKRRLRNIANVPARTPIGLGGVEDRGHAGGSASGCHQSPKPPPNSSMSGGCNDYARYRYYPPLDALPSSSASLILDTPSDLAALHESYTLGSTDNHQQHSMPSSSVTTRNRIYRRGATPRSASVASTTTTTTNNARLAGGTDYDEAEEDEDESVSMNIDESETTPHHRFLQRSSIQSSYYSSSSSVQFTSPPLDPRAGGGRRIIHASSSSASATSTVRRQSPHPHHTLHSNPEAAELNTNSDNGVLTSTTEWITPPAITGALQTPNEHDHTGRDAYSQRGDTSQRRRRRWWDEVNNDN